MKPCPYHAPNAQKHLTRDGDVRCIVCIRMFNERLRPGTARIAWPRLVALASSWIGSNALGELMVTKAAEGSEVHKRGLRDAFRTRKEQKQWR